MTIPRYLRIIPVAAMILASLLFISPAVGADGPVLTEDGLYTESWFLTSFLDLGEDLEEAKAAGKRFVIMWELKGCPYCKETHFVNFQDPEIRAFVQEKFVVLQLNLQGSRAVVDFDGEEIEERRLARKYGIRFSPTFLFFPERTDGLAEMPAKKRAVAQMPGYFQPPHFLAMFHYVHDQAYQTEPFRSYLRRQSRPE
ncbi:MAG: thioredoxin family protein [Rhodospirillales bacterium]|nr:MAG: thioredoxin family protein [Rhodospirillales bacterium]